MSTMSRPLTRAGLAAALLTILPATAAAAGDEDHGRDDPYLLGRAVLPVETVAVGPSSGNFVPQSPRPPIKFPIAGQPVEGFSGVVAGRRPGEYLAMPDNGYGGKATSPDFLIRAYYVTPDFKTAHGGTGTVAVGDGVAPIAGADFIQFSDPDGRITFPLARPDRLLTGFDVDPESIQRDHHGDLWLGDEFGPWILHFDATGRLLQAPIPIGEADEALRSPNNPAGQTVVANSRGLEAMAMTPDGKQLVYVLEGALIGADRFTRRIYAYDIPSGETTRLADYRVTATTIAEADARFVSDAQMLDRHRLLVIERDGGLGPTATFRSVYEVDLRQVGADGTVAKREVVDLAAIPDPDLVSLPEIHEGDIGLGDPFQVTCESIEALYVVSHAELLLACDNNLPNYGRNPDDPMTGERGLADDNEFILVKAPGL